MNSVISLGKHLKRIKGRSFEEVVNIVGQKALFKARRMVNLIREHKRLSWVPSGRYLFKSFSAEIQKQNNNFADIFPLWETRLRRVFLRVASDNFKKSFEQQYRTEKELIFRAAANAARGRIVLFRSFEVELGEDINWHATIINDNTWPVIYFRKINLRDSAKIGDLRTTWELNRHVHWVTLGKAYFLSGESKHFKVFWNQFDSWTKENPFLLGANWLSAMEVGIRLNHWLAAYTLFCDCPSFHKHCKTKFWSWVYLHIHYLLYHFTSEDRGFRNNHLIIEASSLYLAAILLKEYENSSVWRNKAEKVLSDELRLQFLQDGFHYELCSSYHLQVVEAYLFGAIVAGRAGLNSARKWQHDIYKMIQVLCAIAKPDGNLPMLGDGDDGTFLGLSANRTQLNVKYLVDIASNWFPEFGLPSFSKRLTEAAYWFLGSERRCVCSNKKKFQPTEGTDYLLDEAQFAVFKETSESGYRYFLLSAGIKAPFHNYGHRHADLLSINLSLFGKDVLVDPGTYCYNGPLESRRYFQNTDSHNAIIINGKNQFDFDGHFGINRINYRSDLKVCVDVDNGVRIFRGEYIDDERGVWHCRYVILLMPDFVIIHDFCGEGTYSEAKLTFVFAHNVLLSEHNERILCNIGLNTTVSMDLFAGQNTFEDVGKKQCRWIAPSYWTKQKCQSLSMHSRGLHNCFTTVIGTSTRGSYKRTSAHRYNNVVKESIMVSVPGRDVAITFLDKVERNNKKVDLSRTCSRVHVNDLSVPYSIEFDPRLKRFVDA